MPPACSEMLLAPDPSTWQNRPTRNRGLRARDWSCPETAWEFAGLAYGSAARSPAAARGQELHVALIHDQGSGSADEFAARERIVPSTRPRPWDSVSPRAHGNHFSRRRRGPARLFGWLFMFSAWNAKASSTCAIRATCARRVPCMPFLHATLGTVRQSRWAPRSNLQAINNSR